MIYCHGFPASRLEGAWTHACARQRGLRVIAIDRPGYGGSDFQPERSMADWPGDVTAVADALGLAQFSLLGLSGGGPYAAVCAQRLPGRVERLVLVGPLGALGAAGATTSMDPVAAAFVRFMAAAPGAASLVYRQMVGRLMAAVPSIALRILTRAAPAADREALADGAFARVLGASLAEAFRQGGAGAAWDLRLYVHGWAVDPAAITVPTWLFHGEADRTVPLAMGRYYADAIPGCRARYVPAEGHFSLPRSYMSDILGVLVPGGDAP